MRFMALAIIGTLAACLANPALAATKHHGQAAASHKDQPEASDTSPYAPGQQRYRGARHKKKPH
jgi:hypothetical protein